MKFSDVALFLVGLLIYSGPVVPLLVPLFFKRASQTRFRWNRLLFLWLAGLQALLFMPFILKATTTKPGGSADDNYWLFLPFIWGELMLVASTIYAGIEWVRLRRLLRPTLPPNTVLQRTEPGEDV